VVPQAQGRGDLHPPPREAEKHEQWRDYVDDGDLKVYYRGEEVGKRCEVKHYLETDFTSLADFPHKWLFLGNAAAWDRADPKPYIYCVLTRLGTHAAFVPGRAHGSWSRINVTDKRRGTTELTIACPPDVAWWTKL